MLSSDDEVNNKEGGKEKTSKDDKKDDSSQGTSHNYNYPVAKVSVSIRGKFLKEQGESILWS